MMFPFAFWRQGFSFLSMRFKAGADVQPRIFLGQIGDFSQYRLVWNSASNDNMVLSEQWNEWSSFPFTTQSTTAELVGSSPPADPPDDKYVVTAFDNPAQPVTPSGGMDIEDPIGVNVSVSRLLGMVTATMWVLVKVPETIPGSGSISVLGGNNGVPSILLYNVGGGIDAAFSLPFHGFIDTSPITTPVIPDKWMVIMARYQGTTKQMRINAGPWISGTSPSFSGHITPSNPGYQALVIGYYEGMYIADIGSVNNMSISDGIANAIYAELRGTYPWADLP